MDFDSELSAYIEANQDYANELFSIAKQHKMTYMALNAQAMSLYMPILEWFEEKRCMKSA